MSYGDIYDKNAKKYSNWVFDQKLLDLWEMSFDEKLSYICKRQFLNIKQWDDKWGSWRAGIDWNPNTGDCTYIVEQPELNFCLNSILGYMTYDDEWIHIHHHNDEHLHDSKITYSYSLVSNRELKN